MSDSSKTQRQTDREASRAARQRLREQRKRRIRTAMSAQREFMDEYVRVGGEVSQMKHPLASAMLAADGADGLKSSITDFYASVDGSESEPE